jgi:choline monooxygenase
MSDLSLQLQQAASQLPVSSYFDEALFQRELEPSSSAGPAMWATTPCARGGRLLRPAAGKRRPRAGAHATGIELISNVCRHRQAIMLKGAARCDRRRAAPAATSSARCTAGPTAQRRAAGRAAFRHDPCLNLNNYRLREWNGLLFEDNGRDIEADLATWARAPSSTSRLVLDHVEMHECNYNWKTFIEVYLEDYHVGPFHPGLGTSSPATTCVGIRSTTRCRPWAWRAASAARLGVYSAGTRCC